MYIPIFYVHFFFSFIHSKRDHYNSLEVTSTDLYQIKYIYSLLIIFHYMKFNTIYTSDIFLFNKHLFYINFHSVIFFIFPLYSFVMNTYFTKLFIFRFIISTNTRVLFFLSIFHVSGNLPLLPLLIYFMYTSHSFSLFLFIYFSVFFCSLQLSKRDFYISAFYKPRELFAITDFVWCTYNTIALLLVAILCAHSHMWSLYNPQRRYYISSNIYIVVEKHAVVMLEMGGGDKKKKISEQAQHQHSYIHNNGSGFI